MKLLYFNFYHFLTPFLILFRVDEVEPAISLRFINSGTEIWCGFNGALRKFDTDRPGRQTETIFLKKDFPNVTGLVSCIRENPIMPGLLAFGTYSKHIGNNLFIQLIKQRN